MNVIDEVLTSLRRITRSIDIHSKHLVRRHGITVPQMIVLKELFRHDGLVIGELSRAVNLSQATVTDIVARLETRGLVRRTRDAADGRRTRVTLEKAGQSMACESPPLLHERFVAEFRGLRDYEQTQILSSLQRIADLMDIREMEAPPILSTDAGMPDDPAGRDRDVRKTPGRPLRG